MKKLILAVLALAVLVLAGSRVALAQSGSGMPTSMSQGFTSGVLRWTNPLASTTTAVANLSAANQTELFGFQANVAITFSHIVFNVSTADTASGSLCGAFADCYSVGIYSVDSAFPIRGNVTIPGGTLVANCAASAFNTTGKIDCATVQGSQTLQPGSYYFAFTGNSTTAAITVANTNYQFASAALPTSGGTTTNGVLNSSFTPPADSWSSSSQHTVVFALHD